MIKTRGKERVEILADYVVETGATVRACAAHFGISKSTVHKDLTEKLKYINRPRNKLIYILICIIKQKSS